MASGPSVDEGKKLSGSGWGTTADLCELHAAMVRSRVLDQCLADLARRSLVGLNVPARGYEGHIYGALAALRPSDWLFGDLRMSGVVIERGLPTLAWAQMVLGMGSSAHQGHASSAELTARPQNFVSISPLLGSHLAQATGAAQAMKLKKSQDIALCWFGPGAGASGDAHVGLNFAAVYKAPVVFYFCTSGDDAADAQRLSGDSFADRAEGYGMPGVRVDGADAVAVQHAVSEAAARARAGGGPTLIEGRTAPGGSERDPVADVAQRLDAEGLDSKVLALEVASTFEAELREAIQAALTEGPPPSDSLFEQVFVEPSLQLEEQRSKLSAHRNRFPAGLSDLEEQLS